MDDDKMITLHVEYDEEMSKYTAQELARNGPEGYHSPLHKARAKAARKLYPEYKYKVGEPYEVAYFDGPARVTRLVYRTSDGWSAIRDGNTIWDDRFTRVNSVRKVTIGDGVK
jgi:hypothetical protein